MCANIFNNEFDAWKSAKESTKLYFMILENSSGTMLPDSVYYLVCTKENLSTWLLKKAESNNKEQIIRVYSRTTSSSFSQDITEVNNRFQFIGQC